MHLAFDDHRVDDVAKVVHGGEFVDLDLTGFRINFNFRDVGARRIGEIGRVVERVFVQTRLEFIERIVVRHIGGECHFSEGFFLVGAHDFEFSIGEFDVGVGRLQQMRGDFLAFGDDLVSRFHNGRTTHRE